MNIQISGTANCYTLNIRGKRCVHGVAYLYSKRADYTDYEFAINLLESDLVEVGLMKPFNPQEQYMNAASVKYYLLEVEIPSNFDELAAGPRKAIELQVKKEGQLVELSCRDRHPIEHLQLALNIASEFLSNEWEENKED